MIKVGLKEFSTECVYLHQTCKDLSLFFNTRVVTVKLDPRHATELQELFA